MDLTMTDYLELFLHEVIHSVRLVVCVKSKIVVRRMTKKAWLRNSTHVLERQQKSEQGVRGREESDLHFVWRTDTFIIFAFHAGP